jgi:hypothetical protein
LFALSASEPASNPKPKSHSMNDDRRGEGMCRHIH